MRKLSAHYILSPGMQAMPKAILEIDDDGTIINLKPGNTSQREEAKVEFYNGILVPGFVNVHAHLELSALHEKIEEKTGLSKFIRQVVKKRQNYPVDTGLLKTHLALMSSRGTVAIGDISNSVDTIEAKSDSDLFIHTFVEIFSLGNEKEQWQRGLDIRNAFTSAGLPASLTPHAPYSVSEKLWHYFNEQTDESGCLSIHHQESREEQAFISNHSGPLAQAFIRQGIKTNSFPPKAQSSPYLVIPRLPQRSKYLFVHNTFTQPGDLQYIRQQIEADKLFFALCANANLYIENSLPQTLVRERDTLQLCLGTDSLASNRQLSIWEEIKTLADHFPELSLNEMISWATINGAKALEIDDTYGSFEKGKNPGVVLLEGLDISSLRVTKNSRSKRLV